MSDETGAGGAIGDLVSTALAQAWRRDSPVHGESHWLAVAATGLDLAAETGADRKVVFAFGLLHDTRRENDRHDPGHGARAAEFARQLHREGSLPLDGGQLELLCFALELHADGQVSTDATIGTCWDADRLHLPRGGARVDSSLLSTDAARQPSAVARAATRRCEPMDWETLSELQDDARAGDEGLEDHARGGG
jgi:uncharacterized protein